MRFVCDSCRAQYMISDEKVGAKGVKVRCKKCGYVILVRKADAAASAPQPQAEEDGATQVLTNPLGDSPLPGVDTTHPGGSPLASGHTQPDAKPNGNAEGAKGFLSSVEEDEIGAVFDQVLKTGPTPVPTGPAVDAAKAELALGDDDDRLSTRVLDSETVKKLAEESGLPVPNTNGANGHGKKNGSSAVPQDWFVAIDEKQTGPLTVDKLKDLWDRGEIGPDSLCWRAGFSDWMPLSEVAELASELAPKPAKPTIVAPASSKPAVVTVPVESAFSAGGMTKTVRSEVPMLATAPVEETGSWKPSAASALASLVKEEMDSLAKPAAKPEPAHGRSNGNNGHGNGGGGLLDLPGEPLSNSGKHPATDVAMRGGGGLPQPPSGMAMESYPASASYAPSYGGYAPAQQQPQGLSRGLVIGLFVAAFAVLSLVGLVVFLVLGRDRAPAPAGQVAVAPAPAPVKTAEVKMPPPPVGSNGQPLQAVTPPPAPAQPAVAQPPVAAVTAPPSASKLDRSLGGGGESRSRPTRVASAEPREKSGGSGGDEDGMVFGGKPEKSKPVPEANGSDEEFDKMFGGKKKAAAPAAAEEPKKKKEVYVPPAPGGGADLPETLGQAEIMQVVVSNKAAIVRCVSEQKAKDPDASGTLVMRFTVQPSGRTSNVSAVTEEFKATHMAACIGGQIKSWSFPKHKTQGDPINFPFKF